MFFKINKKEEREKKVFYSINYLHTRREKKMRKLSGKKATFFFLLYISIT